MSNQEPKTKPDGGASASTDEFTNRSSVMNSLINHPRMVLFGIWVWTIASSAAFVATENTMYLLLLVPSAAVAIGMLRVLKSTSRR